MMLAFLSEPGYGGQLLLLNDGNFLKKKKKN